VKTKQPKAKPAPKALPEEATPASTTEPAVPLDLLCDMAWRIAFARNSRPANRTEWWDALPDAHLFIQLADVFRKMKHQDAQPDTYVEHADKTISALLTSEECAEFSVTFERGCQLITGKKQADAIAVFRRACEWGYMDVGPEELIKYEAEGFFVGHLAELRAAFLRIRKPDLRKNKSQK